MRKLLIPVMLKRWLSWGREPVVNGELSSFPSVKSLAQFKKDALRRRVWFKLLSRVERGIIDLTIKCVDNIKSRKLAGVVTAIIDKLQSAVESTVDRLVRTVGLPLARKISSIAVSWGNSSAVRWTDDLKFARYLISLWRK
jgi:hypothetical protein